MTGERGSIAVQLRRSRLRALNEVAWSTGRRMQLEAAGMTGTRECHLLRIRAEMYTLVAAVLGHR